MLRISSSVSGGRGTSVGGAGTTGKEDTVSEQRNVGGAAIHGPTWNSTGPGRSWRSCAGPATETSSHGQPVSCVSRTEGEVGVVGASWLSHPLQRSAAVATSMLMQPSGSKQSTNPCAGATPVRRATTRQSHVVARCRNEVNTDGW